MQADSVVTTVGFLVDETPTTYYVAQSKNRMADAGVQSIPKNVVSYRKFLRPKIKEVVAV